MNIDVIRRAETAFRAGSGGDNEGLLLADQSQDQQQINSEVYKSLESVTDKVEPIRWAASGLVAASAELEPAWQPKVAAARQPSDSPLITVGKTEKGAKILIGIRNYGSGFFGTKDFEFVPFLANPISVNMRYAEVTRNFVGYGVDNLPYFGIELDDAVEKTKDITRPIKLYDGSKQGNSFFGEQHAKTDIPETIEEAIERSLDNIVQMQETIRLMNDSLTRDLRDKAISTQNNVHKKVRLYLAEAPGRFRVA